MEIWKRNLIVCWFGMFVTAIGLSQIAPVLPLYIGQLGVHDTAQIEQMSGITFGVTFIILAIFSPIWGQAADKFGRKPMLLRASLGMAVVIFCMGFVQNVYQLMILRMLQGVVAGYSTACTTLIATQTDKEHAGWALGVIATSSISGSLLGPMVGGYLEETIGLRSIFFMTGVLMLIVFALTYIFVKENFRKSDRKVLKFKEVWDLIPNPALLVTMFITAFILQLAFYSIEPIITVYITQLSQNTEHIALISGIAFSASGLSSIIAAPRLGKLSDRIGAQKVMLAALIAAGIIFIPQAFVKSPFQLTVLRFLLGLATAGLTPSVNVLIKKITPNSLTGRVFGFSMSAQYLGTFAGSILGGQVAAYFGIRYVFFITSILLLINALWVYKTVCKRISYNKRSQFAN
ncbi:multidrug efflux MFS transporter [Clostridium sp. CX1]|uniref:multidrug efflux MFS transporter n=1 Tax=Clostridium sp. CX1 TaxID=2978346 RepID=UPI0021BE2287|nr:multidrug efflux MFS transporter [Clostridium sp. CX1]MCT8975677.1 multidrug efflux MFS transporter [Clostridium sp. CX1]